MKKPTFEGALERVRTDPDARLAAVLAAVSGYTLGFVLGFLLGEKEGASEASNGRIEESSAASSARGDRGR